MKPILEINNLCKTYYTKKCEIEALKNISFKVYEGDFIGIVGPSGAGKSTILSIIGSLEDITSGEVKKNNDLRIGYMLQDDCLFPCAYNL